MHAEARQDQRRAQCTHRVIQCDFTRKGSFVNLAPSVLELGKWRRNGWRRGIHATFVNIFAQEKISCLMTTL